MGAGSGCRTRNRRTRPSWAPLAAGFGATLMTSIELDSARQRLLDLRLKRKQAQQPSASIERRVDAIARRAASDPVPLTHTQRRAWFLAQLDPGSTAYNEARAYRLSGPVELGALHESLRLLVERHEVLRTTYAPVGDEPHQFARAEATVDFKAFDLPSQRAASGEEALRNALVEAVREPFDLSHGPLVRFRVIRLGADECVLLRVWHHISADGLSAGVFEREVSALYNGLVEGVPAQLPALPIQYADYALWQRRWLAGAVLQQQVRYWKQQLSGLATLELPTDWTRPAMQSDRGAQVDGWLAPGMGEALRQLGRAEGATLFMVGLAAFKVLLSRYSGGTDIVVGTPIAGRGRTELEGLIGFFANTLVLRTDLSGGPTFRQVLGQVRECALGAYTHQDLPFEKLVEELAPARDLSRNPLFQVCFALQTQTGSGLALRGVQVRRVALAARHAKFDLTLNLSEHAGRLQASFEYCADLFERTTIERMCEHFGVLLESIVADPDQSIDTLGLMRAAERQRLLVQWNDTAAVYPKDQTLAQLFEAQVRRTPAAVALIEPAQQLSYAQLNAQANQLAHTLRARGVGPQVAVAVCMQRSAALIVALLAIVKTGAAYVPLDPELPAERVALILDDTAAPVVVTHAATRDRFDAADRRVVCMDADRRAIRQAPTGDYAASCGPEDLAYIIYTSGSTGRPKGVQIS